MSRALTRFAIVAAGAVSAHPGLGRCPEWRAVSQGCIRSAAGFGRSLATGAAGIGTSPSRRTACTLTAYAWDANGLVILDRNPATGQLTPSRGRTAVSSRVAAAVAAPPDGLFAARWGSRIGPDGQSVYVGSRGNGIGAVAVFARTAGTGALTTSNASATTGRPTAWPPGVPMAVAWPGCSTPSSAATTAGLRRAGRGDRDVHAQPHRRRRAYGNHAQPAGTAGLHRRDFPGR